jgi:DNA transposition AAA+ family ATPase
MSTEIKTERPADKRTANLIFWDDPKIEAEMHLFPAALQPLYQWLKLFARDECRRDVDVLLERARTVGVTIDKTNWVRILKGRWKTDSDGNELPNPYISATNLAQAITAMRDQVRIELLQGGMPFVETGTVRTIWRAIEKRMRKDRVNKFLVILGPTGTQKTAAYKEFSARNPHVKWLESTDNGSMKEFAIRFAVKCGAGRNISYGQARTKIFESMLPHNGQTKAVIIDNMQDMVRSDKKMHAMGKPVGTQPAYQFLRSLQDETGCAVVWSITPENEDQMFNSQSIYLEQFEGRAGGKDGFLRLPNFPPVADLVQIAETLGLKSAEKHKDLLKLIGHERGRIRRFFEIIQDAKDAADADKSPLTAEYIETALEERTVAEPAKKEVRS